MTLFVALRRLGHGEGISTPAYQTADAAGVDLAAALPDGAVLVLEPGARQLVPTGLALQIPAGFEAQIRPRSGLALRYGVTVLNAPGTIDADYRGEIGIVLVNLGDAAFEVRRGDRIAQLVFAPCARACFVEADALDVSPRGEGGFGSTGIQAERSP